MVKRVVSGGDKLKAKLDEIGRSIRKAAKVRVGFLEGATYPNGTPVATIAAIHEFGAPGASIPPRPYFRTMVAEKSSGWPKAVKENLRATNYDAAMTLERVGLGIEGQLRSSIADLQGPTLSPITLMLRKMFPVGSTDEKTGASVGEAARRVAAGESAQGVSTKPLVWTGHMMASVGSDVT